MFVNPQSWDREKSKPIPTFQDFVSEIKNILERILVRKCQRNESKGEECYQMLTNLIKRINWEHVGLPICVSDERPSLHHDHDLHYKSSEIRKTSWRAGQLWGNITTASRSHLCQIDTRINCIVQSR